MIGAKCLVLGVWCWLPMSSIQHSLSASLSLCISLHLFTFSYNLLVVSHCCATVPFNSVDLYTACLSVSLTEQRACHISD